MGTAYHGILADGNKSCLYELAPSLQTRDTLGVLATTLQSAAQVPTELFHCVGSVQQIADKYWGVGTYVTGASLSQVASEKGRFATGLAISMINQLATALMESGDEPHGGLHPDCIVLTKEGQLSVIGLGFGQLIPHCLHKGLLKTDSLYAPELAATGKAQTVSDIFSLGQILYLLLVGKPLAKGGPRPSTTARLPVAIDEFIAKCVHPDPNVRIGSIHEFVSDLRSSIGAGFSLPIARRETEEDIAASDVRWVVSKKGLDYGPYTWKQLTDEIANNTIQPTDVLVDKETGGRVLVGEHPALVGTVHGAKRNKHLHLQVAAETQHLKGQSKRNRVIYMGVVVVVFLGLCCMLLWLKSTMEPANSEVVSELAEVEDADLAAQITFPETKKRKLSSVSSSRPGKRKSVRKKKNSSDVLSLDMNSDLGDEVLDAGTVHSTVRRHGKKLTRCISRHGGGDANITFSIDGPTGRVTRVRVNGRAEGSRYRCLSKAMKSISFPSIDGPRTRAEFAISR